MKFVRKVYENAKVTIPKELRELHGIESGDYVRMELVEVIPASEVPVQTAGDGEEGG